MIQRVVTVALLAVVFMTACGNSGRSVACRNGHRLADVAIILDERAEQGRQQDYLNRHFRPGFDLVAGTTSYSTAPAYPDGPDGTAIVYLYFDAPLSRRERAQVRSEYSNEVIIRAIRFGVRPIGGFVPGGECANDP